MTKYVNCNDTNAFIQFTSHLESFISNSLSNNYSCIVFICIGSDRSTGDSLGPLIGYKLSSLKYQNVFLYGNLDSPVHAKNLEDTLIYINKNYSNPFIIAIDACLGSADHVGYVTIKKGPLKPGTGVNKILPEVGHLSIAGIVNFGGILDFIVLQNTRLGTVMKMADLISMGIKYTIWKLRDRIVTLTGNLVEGNGLKELLIE